MNYNEYIAYCLSAKPLLKMPEKTLEQLEAKNKAIYALWQEKRSDHDLDELYSSKLPKWTAKVEDKMFAFMNDHYLTKKFKLSKKKLKKALETLKDPEDIKAKIEQEGITNFYSHSSNQK
ncbi:MAG: hypothetical protein JW812_01735 [Alphaproteobacteria bacterium]|nr:hypothetical protein [Alphaproteobacteria bacterium]MBN2779751.1 hypothetical protein [Alphaproteobacteria bacterium]